jgi:hypothetical protein
VGASLLAKGRTAISGSAAIKNPAIRGRVKKTVAISLLFGRLDQSLFQFAASVLDHVFSDRYFAPILIDN